jgi:imidazolonepropionase-like amidohydrolase
MRRLGVILWLLSASAIALAGSGAVRCGKLLDVQTGKLLNDQIITFDETGKITAVENAGESSTKPTVNLPEATCLPGLIDVHTHFEGDSATFGYNGLSFSIPRFAVKAVKNARITLNAGFTTVRDVNADGFADVAVRDGINDGDVPGPRMQVSGPAITITGGHNDEGLLGPQYNYSSDGVANGVEGVRAKVRQNIKYGADLIKVMASGGVTSQGDNPQSAEFSEEELRTIVTTAHDLGRKVAAHAHGVVAIKRAVLAGVDSVEHGSFIDDEGIRLMKEHGTYLVPTVYLGEYLLAHGEEMGMTKEMMAKARVVIPAANQHVANAISAGVKIAYGTDPPTYPQGQNAHQFATLVKLGMTPLAAIQSATINAADLMGWSDKVGILTPGHYADVVAVKGDPIQNVRLLESVAFVMRGGEVVRNDFASQPQVTPSR